MTIKAVDKILPTQPYFNKLAPPHYESILAQFLLEFAPKSQFEFVPTELDTEEFSSTPQMLSLMAMIVKMTGAGNILEIGTFVGAMTMTLARAAQPDGKVMTIESAGRAAATALDNFQRNGLSDSIYLIQGDAMRGMEIVRGDSFNLIFIDGAKQDYLYLARASEKLIRPGGMIVIDDVFFHGDALQCKPTTDKGRGCKALLDHYRARTDVEKLLLPVGNGVLILYGFK